MSDHRNPTTLREAINVAWHARTNGLADVPDEQARAAFAILENAGEALQRVEATLPELQRYSIRAEVVVRMALKGES